MAIIWIVSMVLAWVIVGPLWIVSALLLCWASGLVALRGRTLDAIPLIVSGGSAICWDEPTPSPTGSVLRVHRKVVQADRNRPLRE